MLSFPLLLMKIAKEKAVPFERLVPNEETIETMQAARRGELITAGTPEQLLSSLGPGLPNTPAA